MPGDKKPSLIALRDRREEVIDILSAAFADDVLDVDRFDERVSLAHRADSIAELDRIVEDLAPLPTVEDDDANDEALAAPASESEALAVRRDKKTLVAIMSGVDRRGTWRVPARLRVLTVMGGTDLDFREVELPPGVTEVRIASVMGGVDIVVPPDLAVECDGWAILGGFDGIDRAPASPDPDAPLLRITGFAFLGGVDVITRLPGESGWQAWRRRRRERRALRDRALKRLPDATDDDETR